MSESQQPTTEQLEAIPYVAVRAEVSPDTFRDIVDSNFGRPFEWLSLRGIGPAGAPLIRYRSLDANGDPTLIEMGVPVTEPVEIDGEEEGDLVAGELPAGRYVTHLHVGPFQHAELEDLGDASKRLIAWAEAEGIELDSAVSGGGTELGASAEFYLVDPSTEPDFTKWETRIVMRAAG